MGQQEPGDGAVWARVAALQGAVLKTHAGWFRVVAVDDAGVTVQGHPDTPTRRVPRRAVRDALPLVAAGAPLPSRLRTHAPRIAALLHAAGVGTGA